MSRPVRFRPEAEAEALETREWYVSSAHEIPFSQWVASVWCRRQPLPRSILRMSLSSSCQAGIAVLRITRREIEKHFQRI